MTKITSVFESLALIAPELMLGCGAMLLLVIGVWKKGGEVASLVTNLAIYVLCVVLGLVVLAHFSDESFLLFGGALEISPQSQLMKAIIIFSGLFVILMSRYYHSKESIVDYEYPVLILLSLLGMMFMASSANFVVMFMGVELSALSLYIMVGLRRDDSLSSEAALKYFVLGAMSSAVLLFGISYVYGVTGEIGFYEIRSFISSNGAVINFDLLAVSLIFIVVAFAFKLSLVPFHFWAPDVYQGSPTPVTAFLAAAPKIAVFALLVRVLVIPFAEFSVLSNYLISMFAAFSMFFGALFALRQSNIKRLLAFSSISHMGYASLSLLSIGDSSSVDGFTALVVYLLVYTITTTSLFGCVLSLRRNGNGVEEIDDLRGIYKSSPIISIAFTILLFSLAGIPPLAGFLGKLLIFSFVIKGGYYYLAVVGVLSSVMASYYYLNIVRKIYFEDNISVSGEVIMTKFDLIYSRSNIVVIGLGVLSSVILFLFSAFVINLASFP